ncbi:MAG: phosphatase PAP2 family protein [Planctomycetia bacterium]|nr:phosphatase PAP2 family protein [Planctomycetia bacterium]
MKHLVERLGRHEFVVLLAALIVVAGTWGFIALADVVLEGRTQSLDESVLLALRRADNPAMPIGPDWMAEVGRDLTAVGGVAVLLLATLAVAGFLLLDRKYAAMGFVLAAVASGLVVSSLLKACFARPRPDVVPHLSQVYTSSFPSGHSMMSAIVYLTLGALLSHMVVRRPLKFYVLAVALLLTGLVGGSRVYMGVHYPTDVLAGWTAGLVWATLCWLAARKLQRRGLIEKHL